MALPPGTRFGSYEVVGPIGAGGMGEVYHARDTRLARDVAIKVLPDGFAADAERVAASIARPAAIVSRKSRGPDPWCPNARLSPLED